jgi:hypothetical protein
MTEPSLSSFSLMCTDGYLLQLECARLVDKWLRSWCGGSSDLVSAIN